MEPTQILLAVVVTVLTGLLVFVGTQVFLILREMQKTLQKLNKILDDAGLVADTVVKPIIGVANFVEGIKGIKGIIDLIQDKASPHLSQKKKIEAQIPYEAFVEEEEPRTHIESPHIHISEMQERGRRFFHRGGKLLTS